MAKMYSLTARSLIDAPLKSAAKKEVAPSEAEKIRDLEGRLGAETVARIAAEAATAAANRARDIAEAAVRSATEAAAARIEKALQEIGEIRASMIRMQGEARTAAVKAEAALTAERAARVTAEQRATAAEARLKVPVKQPVLDVKQIAAAVSAEINAAAAAGMPYEVDIIERDANGRILRFAPRFPN